MIPQLKFSSQNHRYLKFLYPLRIWNCYHVIMMWIEVLCVSGRPFWCRSLWQKNKNIQYFLNQHSDFFCCSLDYFSKLLTAMTSNILRRTFRVSASTITQPTCVLGSFERMETPKAKEVKYSTHEGWKRKKRSKLRKSFLAWKPKCARNILRQFLAERHRTWAKHQLNWDRCGW